MASISRKEQASSVSVLPEEILEVVFSHLTVIEKAQVASVCRLFRTVSARPCLWRSIDTWGLGWDRKVAAVVSSRCTELQELTARGSIAALGSVHLKARQLRRLHLDTCADLSDAALGLLVGRHEALRSLHLDGASFLTNDSIEIVGAACPLLEDLRLGGLRDCVDKDAMAALFEGCPHLVELSLTDCQMLDENGLAAAKQLQLLSLAGCKVSSWAMAAEVLLKLPNLIGLDVSRTDIYTANTSYLLYNSPGLLLLVALDCRLLDGSLISHRFSSMLPRKVAVFAVEGDLSTALASVRSPPLSEPSKPQLPVVHTRAQALATSMVDLSPTSKHLVDYFRRREREKNSVWPAIDGVSEQTLTHAQKRAVQWVECALVHALHRTAERRDAEMEGFWLSNGTRALVALLDSTQTNVQEKAAVTLADLAIDEAETVTAHVARSTSIHVAGAIPPLLRMTRSTVDSLPGEAMKALGNLCVNKQAAEIIVESGGIEAFLRAAGSLNRWVAEEAAGALWNLSMMDGLKEKLAEAGVLEVLLRLLSRWSKDAEVVQERVAGALANLANHEATSVAMVHGDCLRILSNLLRTSLLEGLQEQIVRVLANLAAQGDCNTSNNVAVAHEPGLLSALVALTKGSSTVLQIEAATAIWNLAFDESVRDVIAAEGGVHSLVTLAKQCCGGEIFSLQERVAGALWGLSASQSNSVLIGEEGGIPPLIRLARSPSEDVQEASAGVLWNLSFDTGNARIMKAEGGIAALTSLCTSPTGTTLAKFMAVLALSYLCDSRAEGDRPYALRPSDNRREVFQHISAFVEEHSQSYIASSLEASLRSKNGVSARGRTYQDVLAAKLEMASQGETSERMREVGDLRCSDFEIERFSAMLRNPYETLQMCAAFALLQFSMPNGRHTVHHVAAMKQAGGQEALSELLERGTVKLRSLARLTLENIDECKH